MAGFDLDLRKEILKSSALSMLNTDGERYNQLWTPYMAWVFNTMLVERIFSLSKIRNRYHAGFSGRGTHKIGIRCLKQKKSVCLLVSAYKLVYLQSSCVAGFLIRSITGCKERDPEKGQTYKPEICSCFGHRSSISSLLPRTEPAPQICPDLE